MMKNHFILFPIILLFYYLSPVSAQQKNFTAKDHVGLEFPSAAVISPDGKNIAMTIRKPDFAASKWNTQIFLLQTTDKKIRRATSSPANCTSPAWSPDGAALSFISSRDFLDDSLRKRSGTPQLFAMPMNGGDAVARTNLPNGVDEYTWSLDGKMIAIVSEEELSDEASAEAEKKDKLKMDWKSSDDPKKNKMLWILDPVSLQCRKIATLDPGAAEISFSPDGSSILYQSNKTGDYNDDQKFDLWLVDTAGKKTQLTSAPGPETKARFSPDGSMIAFITQTVPDIEFAKTEISILDMKTKTVRRLTKEFPYSVLNFKWNKDSKSIAAEINEKTSSFLYTINCSSGKAEKLADGAMVFSGISMTDAGAVATQIETSTGLREIAVIKNKSVEILTSFSKQLDGYALGKQEVISVKSRDGKFMIDAVIVKPENYEKEKKYPLLLAYHGGPYGEFDNKFYQYYPARLLAQEGVVTVMPNVRGGSGYTDEFSQSNRYDLGGGDFRDAMDVVNALIEQGIADSSRMMVMGGSYGGYMTNWTVSQTTRFKAAVSMYGIFSWLTDWSNSFQPAFEQMYFGYNYWEKPLDMNNLWISRAPQTFVKNIVTPTLILQGTEDQYTNISNSREMYQALKENGCTVEFVTYPRAEHGLRTEPNQYLNVLERTVAWFKRYALSR